MPRKKKNADLTNQPVDQKALTKPKIGRPLLPIDEKLVHKLAAIHCTMEEIAATCNCSVDTLENRFSDIIQKAREEGKASLRRMQYQKAQEGNVTMMIWLGKQLLGQREKIDQNINQKTLINMHEQVVREIEIASVEQIGKPDVAT